MFGFKQTAAGLFLAATLVSSFALPSPARAGSEGRRNTAIVLGAIAAQQLLSGKTGTGVVAGAAAAAAYKKYQDAKKDEDRYSYRRRADRSRYDRNNSRYGYDRIEGRRDRDADDRYDRSRDASYNGYTDGYTGYTNGYNGYTNGYNGWNNTGYTDRDRLSRRDTNRDRAVTINRDGYREHRYDSRNGTYSRNNGRYDQNRNDGGGYSHRDHDGDDG